MFDYNKILEIEKINLEGLDDVTLIDWGVLELGIDDNGDNNWICIEVWRDEGDTIKILEQNEIDAEEITHKLTNKQKEHIYRLVNKSIKESA